MSFIDDIKTDQRTQILVAGVVVFALLFPGYFYYAASLADDDLVFSGPAADYLITGEYSYHEIGSGSETIANGGTAEVSANSDSIDVVDLNIVGFKLTTSHTDDENDVGVCTGVDTEDDSVSVSGGIGDNTTSNSGTESPMETSQLFITEVLGTILIDVSSNEIEDMLDGGSTGIGEYLFEIGVTVNAGSRAGICSNNDDGETVDWKLELISLDYSYEIAEEEEEEESDE